jgi:hypothetical protein
MPKHSNAFRAAIYITNKNPLGEPGIASEPHELPETRSGSEHAVDLTIQYSQADHSVTIGIEFRDHAKKQRGPREATFAEESHTKFPPATATGPTEVSTVAQPEPDTPAAAPPACRTDPDARTLHLEMLHTPRLTWRTPGTGSDHPLRAEVITPSDMRLQLLCYLALHPKGIQRGAIIAALWPNLTADTSVLSATLSGLNKHIAKHTGGSMTGIARTKSGRCELDPVSIHVDYWEAQRALKSL